MKRIGILFTTALAVFTLAISLVPRAAAQNDAQDEGPKQRIKLVYPGHGIVLSGTGEDAVKYKGLVYVTVVPITPRLIKKYGVGPMFSDELHCSNSDDDYREPVLPVGEYEVHFSMRDGDTLKTCIKRPIILSPEDAPTVTAEFSDTKTLIIGGDMTAQQMEDSIKQLQQQVAALQAEVAALKGTPAK